MKIISLHNWLIFLRKTDSVLSEAGTEILWLYNPGERQSWKG
jgi:hypothetical protein